MEALLPLFLGFLIALGLFLRRRWKRAHVAAPVASEGDAAVFSDMEPGSLSARLHALEAQYSPFANASAHPRELTEHNAFKHAVDLLADPDVALPTVLQYVQGMSWTLACAGLGALARRADRAQAADPVLAQIDKLAPWPLYFALEYVLSLDPRPPAGAPLVAAKDWWRETPMIQVILREYLARRGALNDPPAFGPALHGPLASPISVIRDVLQSLATPYASDLLTALAAIERQRIDRVFLMTFGRFWEGGRPVHLIEPEPWGAAFAAAEAALAPPRPRSLLVSGDPLVGKTAFLQLLAARLARGGWTVFEASGADLMADQLWFGQLEGRIRQAVDQLAAERGVIWYIPDLLQLAQSGTHRSQSASILDQILPAIAAGRLLVWAETTPAELARLLQIRPSLRGLLEVVQLAPHAEAEALALAHAVARRLADALEVTIEPECAEIAVDSARHYLSSSSLPGSALQLIKLALVRSDVRRTAVGKQDILKSLAQLTGLPISILDGEERLDLASIRAYFAERVIGQDEAVDAVVERIAMLKAGLNDPLRPVGVFLFAGPTGTGKTELAKTAATFLFGSVERLIRLDMSEFQTAESIAGIIGGGPLDRASLISHVRKQPFSVVLLDEFEKAHPNIWDLFLQVFDDARLTDAAGQVADFRHCLIIMTTNLGATAHQSLGLGFAPAAAAFSSEQVLKAIRQTYRPEFQNRIDRVIVFRPLTRELMRVILHKELRGVLERRGLKDRTWAVEWEASALEFLLEKGFSPEMGARPLKRAIEQYVIAPLAATIVEKRFPEGEQFVFVRSDGRAIQAEFVDPDAEPAAAAPRSEGQAAAPTLAAMILSPRGAPGEQAALAEEASRVERALAAAEWQALKHRLADTMSKPGFWDRADRYRTLARLALMDRVAAAAETVVSLGVRLDRGSGRTGRPSRELIGRIALQLHLVKEGIQDAFDDAPVEVVLAVEPALAPAASGGESSDDWCRDVHAMYRAWAGRRHMQVTDVRRDPQSGLPILVVSGFGAHRLLARECGLHVLELGSGGGANRAVARVRLAEAPLGDVPAARMAAALAQALERAPALNTVVRRYRREPSPLVRNADGSWRTGKLDAVLGGDFDLLAADDA